MGALRLLAMMDPSADDEDRYQGALLLHGAIQDLHHIRLVLDAALNVKTK